MAEVLVLHARLPSPVGEAADGATRLLARLPYAYRLELESRAPALRLASLAGLALLRTGAARWRGVVPDPACLEFPQGGKPRLPGGPHFSVAHSSARVAVALCADCAVGIDVEEIVDHAVAGDRLARQVASEAALKACGAGLRGYDRLQLDDDLAVAQLDATAAWLRPVELAAGSVGWLAALAPCRRVVIEAAVPEW
jgi:hypothetical protein